MSHKLATAHACMTRSLPAPQTGTISKTPVSSFELFIKCRFVNFPLPFLPLVGGGYTKFQPVHVGDVAEALAKCATSDAGKSLTVDCCGPEVTFECLITC